LPLIAFYCTFYFTSAEEDQAVPAWTRNAKNGRFTNFVNLLDMCGVSVPSGLLQVDYANEEASTGSGEGGAKI
jgi:hypothetical protein